jgi:hypothetical protein
MIGPGSGLKRQGTGEVIKETEEDQVLILYMSREYSIP